MNPADTRAFGATGNALSPPLDPRAKSPLPSSLNETEWRRKLWNELPLRLTFAMRVGFNLGLFLGLPLAAGLALLSLAAPLLSAPGSVQTRDGKIYDGELRLDPMEGIVLTSAAGMVVKVAMTNLASARFNLPRTPTNLIDSIRITTLPEPWKNVDIGPVGLPGRAVFRDDTFTVSASGTRLWSEKPDELHFVYRPFKGNGQFIAQVPNFDASIAGIMLRKELTANSEFVMEAATGGGEGLMFRSRREPAHRKLVNREGDWQNRDEMRVPMWLRLVRRDKWVNAYRSWDDGMSWEHISGSPDDWPREVYAGLFVLGGKTNELKEATFANVLVTDETLETGAHTNESFVPQVLLKGGTLLAGNILAFDRSSLTLSNLGRARVISAVKVARVHFHPRSRKLEHELTPGRRGALLASGDFFEGEFASLEKDRLEMSSVLFGHRSFKLGDQVIALVLADPSPATAAFTVRTTDGSELCAPSITPEPNAVAFVDPTLGQWRIPVSQLVEITQAVSTAKTNSTAK